MAELPKFKILSNGCVYAWLPQIKKWVLLGCDIKVALQKKALLKLQGRKKKKKKKKGSK